MTEAHQAELLAEPTIPGFVYGIGASMQALNDMAGEIAPTDIPVLVIGESGTGKDAYARLIHRLSPQHQTQFCKINCASFDPGHVSGQLRASRQQSSLAVASGILYLDNVQELDMASQRVLLSLLPDGETSRLNDEISMRLVSSTATNLESEVESGRFRRELYFRLNGACLRLPPLRDRIEDVPAFAEYFLNKYSHALKKPAPLLNDETIHTLSAYRWPGNIRELENLARKMVVFGDPQIALKDLAASSAAKSNFDPATRGTSLKIAARAASEKAERELILQALERTHWNRKRAARELQVSYKSLLCKIKQIGVSDGKHEG